MMDAPFDTFTHPYRVFCVLNRAPGLGQFSPEGRDSAGNRVSSQPTAHKLNINIHPDESKVLT
jgi:hypothetical protein